MISPELSEEVTDICGQYIYGDNHDRCADIHLLSEILNRWTDIFTRPIDKDHARIRRPRLYTFDLGPEGDNASIKLIKPH